MNFIVLSLLPVDLLDIDSSLGYISDVWLQPGQGKVVTTENWSWESDQSKSKDIFMVFEFILTVIHN